MDIRDGIGLSGSASYYLSRGAGSGSGGGGGGGPPQPPPGIPAGFKAHSNPNIAVQSNVRGGGSVSSAFQVEDPPGSIIHGINMGTTSGAATPGDPVKKKRGRPRKYAPEGANMSLALSPMSSLPSPGSITPGPKRAKGRPPGTGWKQQLAPLGILFPPPQWLNLCS